MTENKGEKWEQLKEQFEKLKAAKGPHAFIMGTVDDPKFLSL